MHLLSDTFEGQKSRYRMAQLSPLLRVSQKQNQGVGRAIFTSEGSGNGSAFMHIQVAGRIELLVITGRGSCFLVGGQLEASLRSPGPPVFLITSPLHLQVPLMLHTFCLPLLPARAYVITLGPLDNPG